MRFPLDADISLNEYGVIYIDYNNYRAIEVLFEDPFPLMAEMGMLGPIQRTKLDMEEGE